MNDMTFLAASAIAPCLLLLWFFSSRDLNPEPRGKIWAAFWTGVAAMLLALVFGLPIQALLPEPVQAGPYLYGLLDAFLVAAIPEECAKFLLLRRFCRKTPECDEPMDCVVYAVAASLGFAALENVLYVSDGGLPLALLRAVSAVPSHALYGAIMGYFLGRALFGRAGSPGDSPGGSPGGYALSLLAPIAFHGLYDLGPLILTACENIGCDMPDGEGVPLAFLSLATLIAQALIAAVMLRTLRDEQRRARQPLMAPDVSSPPPARAGFKAVLAMGTGWLLILGSVVIMGLAALGSADELARPDVLSDLALGLSILTGPPVILGALLVRYARRRFRAARTRELYAGRFGGPF